MSTARSQNPFLLVLLIVGLLSLLSLLDPDLVVGGLALRPVRLLADVRPLVKPALPPPGPVAGKAPATAAGERAARFDGLAHFVAALRQTKATGRAVRIAYFGDSMIEGDLITSDLRNLLQEAFGGSGVGFVPIASVAASSRATIRASASGNWRQYSLVSPQVPASSPLGIAGQVFVPRVVPAAPGPDPDRPPAGSSWVDFQGGRPWARVRRLAQARLFYGPGAGADRVLATTDAHTSQYALTGTAPVNTLAIRPDSAGRRLRLSFATHAPRPVYGVSFEGPGGVMLDNFSFRGSNGLSLRQISAAQLAAFGPALDYRLIILHYGVNITDESYKSYAFYERGMREVIARLQHAFPQASILVVGMSDKSTRRNGEFQTNPAVPRLLAAQQRLAQQTHAAFWNLYEAMGGQNAMVSWVESTPPLANHDYTHVNFRGGRKIAELLFQFLLQHYEAAGPPPQRAPPAPANAARPGLARSLAPSPPAPNPAGS